MGTDSWKGFQAFTTLPGNDVSNLPIKVQQYSGSPAISTDSVEVRLARFQIVRVIGQPGCNRRVIHRISERKENSAIIYPREVRTKTDLTTFFVIILVYTWEEKGGSQGQPRESVTGE